MMIGPTSHIALHQAAVRTSGQTSLRFAAINIHTPDSDKTDPDVINRFIEPDPSPRLQKLMQIACALVLKYNSKIRFDLPESELAHWQNVPENAGMMVVGPHPDMDDGFTLFTVLKAVKRLPQAGFFGRNELLNFFQKPFLDRLIPPIASKLAFLPASRGDSKTSNNGRGMEYMAQQISRGKTGAILPEGSVYYSRELRPMDYGAIKVAVDAVLKARDRGEDRPVYLAPFTHMYFHTDRAEMCANMDKALSQLESLPDIFGEAKRGELRPRLMRAARKILEHKIVQYQLPVPFEKNTDLFQLSDQIEDALLQSLERKYWGDVRGGFHRRRAFKVRAEIYSLISELKKIKRAFKRAEAGEIKLHPSIYQRLDRLKTLTGKTLDSIEPVFREDIKKTQDVVMLLSFHEAYVKKYNDLEMIGEFIRRFRDTMGLVSGPFGKRTASVKLLKPWDMRPHADKYEALLAGEGESAAQKYLFELTEKLRQYMQSGVDKVYADYPHHFFLDKPPAENVS